MGTLQLLSRCRLGTQQGSSFLTRWDGSFPSIQSSGPQRSTSGLASERRQRLKLLSWNCWRSALRLWRAWGGSSSSACIMSVGLVQRSAGACKFDSLCCRQCSLVAMLLGPAAVRGVVIAIRGAMLSACPSLMLAAPGAVCCVLLAAAAQASVCAKQWLLYSSSQYPFVYL